MVHDGHVSGELIGTEEEFEGGTRAGTGVTFGSSTIPSVISSTAAATVSGSKSSVDTTPPSGDPPSRKTPVTHKTVPPGTIATQMVGLDGHPDPTASRSTFVNSTSGSQGVHETPLNRRLFASPDGSARLSSGLEGLHHTESPGGGRSFTVQDLQKMIVEGV